MDTNALDDEELYIKYSDRLIRFASFVVGPADAEDVMIEGVLRAFESRNWHSVKNRPAFLYQSVLNAGRTHLRSSKRRTARELKAHSIGAANAPIEGLALSHEVRDAVACLSPRQRAVIFLTYWEDLDERASANQLGISVGSVRRHLFRARKNLEEQLHV